MSRVSTVLSAFKPHGEWVYSVLRAQESPRSWLPEADFFKTPQRRVNFRVGLLRV